MAHAIETMGSEATFATRDVPAWHGLGTVFAEDVTTSEMLSLAHLNDWNVRVEPVLVPDTYRTVSENYMVLRDNPFDKGTDVLAFVGKKYRPFQNESLFAFADNILDGGARWETAGSIKDGRTVFGSLAIDRQFILDPQGANDATNTYLLVHTGHDGSASVTASVTPVRVVCQNTLNMALKGSKQTFKVRHTAGTHGRVDEARRVLGLTFAHMDKFEDMARALFETTINDVQFDKIVEAIYPMPDVTAKASLTKWEQKRDLVHAIYKNSPTQTNIYGNAWGALNALTERLDYFRNSRSGNNDSLLGAASGFDPSTNAEKALILGTIREFAGV